MHDLNGTPLKIGDKITIEYEINYVNPGEDFCNIGAQSVHGRKPDGSKECFSGNSAVAVLQKSS